MKMSWNYKQPHEPQSDEVAKENNGYALEDLYDANGVLIAKKGQLLSSFAHLRDDGTTASSCWIYTGSWTEQGNQMANRDNSDPSGLGNTLGWAWAWPLNRRVLYNRASADINGKPWDPKRMLIQWNGSKWTGNDIPDFGNAAPGTPTGPFIMQPEGMGRLFAINKMAEGPFPDLDQARIAQRNCSAGTVCGNQRNAGGCERHCQWRSCHCLQQAWLYPRGGCGNAPSETAECKRSAG